MDANDTPNIPITSQPTATKSILKKTTSLAQKKRKKMTDFISFKVYTEVNQTDLGHFYLKKYLSSPQTCEFVKYLGNEPLGKI